MTRIFLILTITAFGVYSAYLLVEYGYIGLWQAAFANAATTLVTLDLVSTCALAVFWIIADARQSGRDAWP